MNVRGVLLCFMLMAWVMLSGCRPPGLNVERSALRGGGDLGVTAILDAQPIGKVDTVSTEIREGVAAARKLFDEGTLTLGAFREKIIALFPSDMQRIAATILSAIEGTRVPTEKLGPANKKRILAALNGADAGLNAYSKEDRPPLKKPPAP